MQQHTGVPPIIMQQQQPAFMQAIMQSQQPWIMSQQVLSPLVQVIMQPSLVISILQTPIVMLQQHTIRHDGYEPENGLAHPVRIRMFIADMTYDRAVSGT